MVGRLLGVHPVLHRLPEPAIQLLGDLANQALEVWQVGWRRRGDTCTGQEKDLASVSREHEVLWQAGKTVVQINQRI
ncbi:hypothetical protein D3C72_1299610 [compost metagenome]